MNAKQLALANSIMEWMYLNDGNRPNKCIWRRDFLMVLKALIVTHTSDEPKKPKGKKAR